MNLNERFQPIRNGLLEFVVLTIIATRKVYVADLLATLAKTEFKSQEGTLYPLLSRLRREGHLQYEWRESETGPPRKYYSLTSSGTAYLSQLKDYWRHLNATISSLRK